MTYRLKIEPDARFDLLHAKLWYNNQSHGLGFSFVKEVDRVLNQVKNNPKQFPKLSSRIRRATLRRFPYSVFFIERKKTIHILAVFHQHRDPINWQKRGYF